MKFCNRLCNYNIIQFFSFLNFKKNVVLDELVPTILCLPYVRSKKYLKN